MEYLCHIYYACLRLWFLDAEINPGTRRHVPAVCRILCSNVRGLARNLSDLTVVSSQYDIPLCSETLVSDTRHVLELLVPGPNPGDRIRDRIRESCAGECCLMKQSQSLSN